MDTYNLDFILAINEMAINEKQMLENAILSVNQLNLWEWLREFGGSFMFNTEPNVLLIVQKMEENGYSGHSGSSFACTMRNMQYIARYGYEAWKTHYLDSVRGSQTKTKTQQEYKCTFINLLDECLHN